MNNLVTDVKNLELETLKNLRSSKSINTLRAYKADYKDFADFCIRHTFKPMPSEPKIISLYLTYLSKSSKFSTLKRRLASISVIHKLSGHYIDTKHPVITENLMGIKRINGSHQKAKKPILIRDLKAIVDAIQKDKNEKNRLKNKALILIGFAGGFRRSELVAVHYEDLDFVSEGV
ncbi:integrase, partial [Pelagibacteraceae bacterium]|nr:integrase [Pelagibacteraceae bacterium]